MPRGKRIWHFATRDDYRNVVSDLAEAIRVKYVYCEERENPDFRIYQSPLDRCGFGQCRYPSWVLCGRFLILPQDTPLHYEHWPEREISEKYGFDGQHGNDKSVVFHPSSLYNGEVGEGMLSGEINTVSQHPTSLVIFDALRKSIRNRFERIGNCYIGPEAVRMLDAGFRLTQDLRVSREGDLRRPARKV